MDKRLSVYHLTGLNGLRALAALGVLYCHLVLALASFNVPLLFGMAANGFPVAPQTGKYGVVVFFALSGFLITCLLLREKEKGLVQIKKFYLRRILRIWPLYYFYIGLAFLSYLIFRVGYPGYVLPYYLFFSANVPYILRVPLPFAQHYWSLAAEEQFYLFWPWIAGRIKIRLLTVVLTLIALLIFIKLFWHFVLKSDFAQIFVDAFPFHCMMIGGAGAILYQQSNKRFLTVTDNRFSQAVAWLFIVAVAINRFHIASVLDPEIIAIVTVVVIIGQINQKNRLINLEQKAFDFVGKISYGIYIYHPLLIFLLAKLIAPLRLPLPLKYALVLLSVVGGTIAVAWLSYTYFEHYFLKLKERFTVIKSSPVKAGHETGADKKSSFITRPTP